MVAVSKILNKFTYPFQSISPELTLGGMRYTFLPIFYLTILIATLTAVISGLASFKILSIWCSENAYSFMVVSLGCFLVFIVGSLDFYLRNLDVSIKSNLTILQQTYPESGGETWDYIQKTLLCCGVESYNDWDTYYSKVGAYPNSCCTGEKWCYEKHVYTVSCLNKTVEYFQPDVKMAFEASGISAALTLIMAMIAICSVYSKPSPFPIYYSPSRRYPRPYPRPMYGSPFAH